MTTHEFFSLLLIFVYLFLSFCCYYYYYYYFYLNVIYACKWFKMTTIYLTKTKKKKQYHGSKYGGFFLDKDTFWNSIYLHKGDNPMPSTLNPLHWAKYRVTYKHLKNRSNQMYLNLLNVRVFFFVIQLVFKFCFLFLIFEKEFRR